MECGISSSPTSNVLESFDLNTTLKPQAAGMILNFEHPEDLYNFVQDPTNPKTVWPETYRCHYECKLMMKAADLVNKEEEEKKASTPRSFNIKDLKLSKTISAKERLAAMEVYIHERMPKTKNNGPVSQSVPFTEVVKEEFVQFKVSTGLNSNITKKDYLFYWNLIWCCNTKVSKGYTIQTKFIKEDENWTKGNFFLVIIVLTLIKVRCRVPMAVEGDKQEHTEMAIKLAHQTIGGKNEVSMETMLKLSCVPALLLLNSALNNHKLQPLYIHPSEAAENLLAMHQHPLLDESNTHWYCRRRRHSSTT